MDHLRLHAEGMEAELSQAVTLGVRTMLKLEAILRVEGVERSS